LKGKTGFFFTRERAVRGARLPLNFGIGRSALEQSKPDLHKIPVN
jgi:hypothetical protein